MKKNNMKLSDLVLALVGVIGVWSISFFIIFVYSLSCLSSCSDSILLNLLNLLVIIMPIVGVVVIVMYFGSLSTSKKSVAENIDKNNEVTTDYQDDEEPKIRTSGTLEVALIGAIFDLVITTFLCYVFDSSFGLWAIVIMNATACINITLLMKHYKKIFTKYIIIELILAFFSLFFIYSGDELLDMIILFPMFCSLRFMTFIVALIWSIYYKEDDKKIVNIKRKDNIDKSKINRFILLLTISLFIIFITILICKSIVS